MISQLFEWKKVRVVLEYAVYIMLAMILQSLLFSRFSVFGVKGFILPAAAVAVGMYRGGVRGTVFGLFLGLFADMAFSETTILFTLLFPILGFAFGFAADFYINKSFFAFMVFTVFALLVTALMQLLSASIISGAPFFRGIITAVGQTLVSIIPSALLYLPFRNSNR